MGTPSAKPLLLVISAPSGAGKTTACQQLLAAQPELARVITCTTRQPRRGEQNGADYFFLTEDDFDYKVQRGEFLEHASVYGNSYGTLKTEVLGKLRQGRDVLLVVDVQGVASIQARAREDSELCQSLVTVFLTTPTLEELERRLRHRGTDAEDVIQRRLKQARSEITQWNRFDYLVISQTIPETLRRLQVIMEAEKMRQHRCCPPAS